jgi:hypothetical protein
MEDALVADLQQYLAEPTPERFLDLRAAVAGSPGYAPYSTDLQVAWPLFEENRFEEAKDLLEGALPGWILNPGIHQMLSFAWHKLGQEDAAQYEFAVAVALLGAILSTGDGSKAQPYLVLYPADEYDMLKFLEKQSIGQSLEELGDKHYDCQMCDDGTEIWFDVTVPYAHLQKRYSK